MYTLASDRPCKLSLSLCTISLPSRTLSSHNRLVPPYPRVVCTSRCIYHSYFAICRAISTGSKQCCFLYLERPYVCCRYERERCCTPRRTLRHIISTRMHRQYASTRETRSRHIFVLRAVAGAFSGQYCRFLELLRASIAYTCRRMSCGSRGRGWFRKYLVTMRTGRPQDRIGVVCLARLLSRRREEDDGDA